MTNRATNWFANKVISLSWNAPNQCFGFGARKRWIHKVPLNGRASDRGSVRQVVACRPRNLALTIKSDTRTLYCGVSRITHIRDCSDSEHIELSAWWRWWVCCRNWARHMRAMIFGYFPILAHMRCHPWTRGHKSSAMRRWARYIMYSECNLLTLI